MPLFDRPPIDAISVSNTLFSQGTFRITGGPGVNVSSDASGAVVAAPGPSFNYFDNAAPANTPQAITNTAMSYNTLLVQPLTPSNEVFPGEFTASTMMVQFSYTGLSGASSTVGSGAHTSSVLFGLYSRVNSTQLTLLNSVSSTWSRGASAGNSSFYLGQRWLSFHSSQWSAQPALGQSRYYFGFLVRSAGTTNSGSMVGQFLQGQAVRSGTINSGMTSGNTGLGYYPFMGIHNTSQTAMPVSIGASQINQANALANFIPNVVFNNVASAF